MVERRGAVKHFLRFRVAGDREVYLAKPLALGVNVAGARDKEHNEKSIS
jgi:hypothetical protein